MRTDFKEILFEIKENAAWITINRPEVRNAFREQTLDEMREAVLQTKEDVTISCIVFTGAGDEAFSAGGDFYAMKRLNWSNASHWNDRMLGLAMAIRGVSIPVIASGGVSSLNDLKALKECGAKLNGAISGRALYDQKFTVQQALEVLNA